jgi:endo-1,4-beta-xylanase
MDASPSLRDLARSRGAEFGAAVSLQPLLADPAYREALQRECGVVVAENAAKFGPLCPEDHVWDYSGFDQIADFAEREGMRLRGHCLVWHNQAPAWLLEKSPSEMRAAYSTHIPQTVDRYRGRIESWDVVNEAVDDQARMRDVPWTRALGEDGIEWAFRAAHEADPNAELVYNDYSIEEVNPKSDRVYALVSDLLRKSAPIHAVGFQAHLESHRPPDLASVRANLRRFRELGIRMLVTEMDVRISEPFSLAKLEEQSRVYEGFLRTCLEEGVERIVTWGISDKYSWVPGFFKGTGQALPLDDAFQPKPAYHGIARALA